MIRYKKRKKYKYILDEDFSYITTIYPKENIEIKYILLNMDGTLTIKKGYSWDGPSGPTFDTKDFMQGALVHDALYQLIRENHLDTSYRSAADDLLLKICREDGMSKFRSWYVYKAVRAFCDFAIKSDILTAP